MTRPGGHPYRAVQAKPPTAEPPTAEPCDIEPRDPYGFPGAVRTVGGFFPSTRWARPAPAATGRTGLERARQVAALNQDYPDWRITCVRRSDGSPGGWWAMRHTPLTAEQRAAGLVPSIARADIVSLVSELAVQDDIAMRASGDGACPRPHRGGRPGKVRP